MVRGTQTNPPPNLRRDKFADIREEHIKKPFKEHFISLTNYAIIVSLEGGITT
jgi:hypothetical protein